VRAVSRQVFRPVPRPGFHSAIFKRKRLLGRTSYPTFLDMGHSNSESLELNRVCKWHEFLLLNGTCTLEFS
jgi:hypothetical protein